MTKSFTETTDYLYQAGVACFLYFIVNIFWPKVLEGGLRNIFKINILTQETFRNLTKKIDSSTKTIEELYDEYITNMAKTDGNCFSRCLLRMKQRYIEKKIVHILKIREELEETKININLLSKNLFKAKEQVITKDIEGGTELKADLKADLDVLKNFIKEVNTNIMDKYCEESLSIDSIELSDFKMEY